MIPFNKPPFTGNEEKYVLESMKSSKISGDGDFTKKYTIILYLLGKPKKQYTLSPINSPVTNIMKIYQHTWQNAIV